MAIKRIRTHGTSINEEYGHFKIIRLHFFKSLKELKRLCMEQSERLRKWKQKVKDQQLERLKLDKLQLMVFLRTNLCSFLIREKVKKLIEVTRIK